MYTSAVVGALFGTMAWKMASSRSSGNGLAASSRRGILRLREADGLVSVVLAVLVRLLVALMVEEGWRVCFRLVLAKREKWRGSVRGGLWEAR